MAELRPFNPIVNMMNGQSLGQNRQIMDQRNQLFNRQQQQNQVGDAQAQGQFMYQAALGLRNLPAQQRAVVYEQTLKPQAQALGIDVSKFDPANFTDQNLDQVITSLSGFYGGQQGEGFTLSENQVRFDANGNPIAANIRSGDDPMSEYERNRIENEQRNADLREQELDFRKSQATTVRLSPTTQKILDQAQTNAFDSGTQAREMELLARDIQRLNIGGGVQSTFSEKLKRTLGTEESVSDIRRRFRAFRASQAVTNLPPGVASDKDIELALSGFPGENANDELINSFLIGQAKLARMDEAYNTLKAEIISEQGDSRGLLGAWKQKLRDKDFVSSMFQGLKTINSVEDTSSFGSKNNSFTSSSGIQFTVE